MEERTDILKCYIVSVGDAEFLFKSGEYAPMMTFVSSAIEHIGKASSIDDEMVSIRKVYWYEDEIDRDFDQ